MLIRVFDFNGGINIFNEMSTWALNELLFEGKEQANDLKIRRFVKSSGDRFKEVSKLRENIENMQADDFKPLGYLIEDETLQDFKEYALNEIDKSFESPTRPSLRKKPLKNLYQIPSTRREMVSNPLVLSRWFFDGFYPASHRHHKVLGWKRSQYRWTLKAFHTIRQLKTERNTLIPITSKMIRPGTPNSNLDHLDMTDKNSLEFRKTTFTYNTIAKGLSEYIHHTSQYAMNEALDKLQAKALDKFLGGDNDWQITEEDIQRTPALTQPLRFRGTNQAERDNSKSIVIGKLQKSENEDLMSQPISYYDIYCRYKMDSLEMQKIVNGKVVSRIVSFVGKDLLKMKLGFLNSEIETFGKLIKKHKGDYNKAVWEYLSGSVFSDKEQKMVGLTTGLANKKHRAKIEQFMDALAVLATNQIEILGSKYPLVTGQEMEEKMLRPYEWTMLQLYFNLDSEFPEYIKPDDDVFNPDE
jgi:hypothetical protein